MSLLLITDERGIKVWRDDKGQFPRYSVSVSKKNDQGKYENCYIDVHFKRDVELANGTEISINASFPSFNVGKDGKKYMYWQIMDFDIISQPDGNKDYGFVNVPDGVEDETPFE